MTRTQLIYDNEGYIISTRQGSPEPREPIGVPFLWVEIPEGKQLKIVNGIGVDVSVTPHQAILEDIPATEMDLLQQQVQLQNEAIMELTMMLAQANGGN